MIRFENPANGHIVNSPCPWLWALLFNWMYFAYKGAWAWALFYFIATLCTLGVAALVFPFYAAKIVRGSYLQRGWYEVRDDGARYARLNTKHAQSLATASADTLRKNCHEQCGCQHAPAKTDS